MLLIVLLMFLSLCNFQIIFHIYGTYMSFKPNINHILMSQSILMNNKNSTYYTASINNSIDEKDNSNPLSHLISSIFPNPFITKRNKKYYKNNSIHQNYAENIKDKSPLMRPINEVITLNEMSNALDKAAELLTKSSDQIIRMGWKLVHHSTGFSLYKRKENNKGPAIYLMLGQFNDISARNFLFSQISKSHRSKWDTTMKDMKSISDNVIDAKMEESEDILYFRTKWPWPLKDRDYLLARRTFSFPNKNAIVFASKSTEISDQPLIKDVIRVDNYYCFSTIFANQFYKSNNLDTLESHNLANVNFISDNNSNNKKNSIGFDFSSKIKQLGNQISKDINYIKTQSNDMKTNIGNSFKFLDRHSHDNKYKPIPSTSKVISGLDLPGMKFVTIFCDDQRVPLPRTVVDLLSKYAEKLVPESTLRLHDVALTLQNSQ